MTHEAPTKNPLALGLVVIGSLAMAVSAFLPLDESVGFHQIKDNMLIQHGGGWILIALSLAIAAYGYRVHQGQSTMAWSPLVLCGVTALLIIFVANDKSFRTLYPVEPDGTLDTSQPGTTAGLGIAVYLAGAGVAGAAVG